MIKKTFILDFKNEYEDIEVFFQQKNVRKKGKNNE